MSALQRLKERKLVQWTVAYLAGAWLALEVFDLLRDNYDWSPDLFPVVVGVLAVGLAVTLVLAWYHGEQGRQRVSGPELLIIGGILLVAALLTTLVFGSDQSDGAEEAAASAAAEVPLAARPGIAVLPFDNRSPDPDDAYFAAGVHDDLLTALSRLPGLKVISRTSVEAYAETDLTAPQIGAELNARYLLEGGVQRAGDRVRINVQLIDSEEEGHIWSEIYTRELSAENLFEVQEAIVSTVAGQLSVELSSEERARLARARTDNDEAWDLYLRASSPGSGGERAIELLERAVALDPTFVDAWARLSSLHSLFYGFFSDRTSARRIRARETAERAVELDATNALAQLAMGEYYYRVERDWDQALEWLERGAGTLQGDVQYHFLRGSLERRIARWDEALGSYRRAAELNPRGGVPRRELGLTHLLMRHFDEAERAFAAAESISGDTLLAFRAQLELMRAGALSPRSEQVLGPAFAQERGKWAQELESLEDSDDPIVTQIVWAPRDFFRGIALRGLGRDAEAVDAFTRAADALRERTAEAPDDPRAWSILGMAYAALGRAGEAREAGERAAFQLRSLEDDAVESPYFLLFLAVTYTWLGDHEGAIDTLDRLLGMPSRFTSVRLENHAWLADLHDDPRFQEVMDEHRERVF